MTSRVEECSIPRKHVAVLVFPFTSHVPPFVGIVRQIASSAPPGTVLFSFFGTRKSNAANFPDNPVEGGDQPAWRESVRVWDVDDGLPQSYVPSPHKPVEPVELFLKMVPEKFITAVKAAEEEVGCKISCLVTDAFYWFGAEMAHELGGVPWVPVWTSGPRPLLAHINTELVRQKVETGLEEKPIDFIPGLNSIRAIDLPQEVVVPNPASPFSGMIDKMEEFLPKATVVVLNAFQELDPCASNQLCPHLRRVLHVGPLVLSSPPAPVPDQHGCIPWLDQQKPNSIVYISFGNVITPPPHELVALTEALETTGVQFLWSFRGEAKEKLPRDFIERTKEKSRIVPWAPQLEILRHKSVGAFVTHGGWNSLIESIIGGVPLIVRPFFGDQLLNRRMVDAVWKIGVGVEGGVFTKSGMVTALERVMFHEEGLQMKERVSVFKNMALDAVGTGGSSTRNFESLIEIITG